MFKQMTLINFPSVLMSGSGRHLEYMPRSTAQDLFNYLGIVHSITLLAFLVKKM